MRWYDHAALIVALILAMWSNYDAGISLRASVMLYFATIEPDRWVRGYDLRTLFGAAVYQPLRWLTEAKIIERREEPGGPKRGFRAAYSYRRVAK